VIIGVDPHKASHTAVAISDAEQELDRKKVRSGGAQLAQLVSWAEPYEKRTWAIESASGLGYLLAQQLVAAGEAVVDVPATLASRARLLATGRSNKDDPNDAYRWRLRCCVRRTYDASRRLGTVKCCACSRNGTSTSGTNGVGSCLACISC
jgi:transposase